MSFVIGIGIGGTFTDAFATDTTGRVYAAKSPSTPPDFEQGPGGHHPRAGRPEHPLEGHTSPRPRLPDMGCQGRYPRAPRPPLNSPQWPA